MTYAAHDFARPDTRSRHSHHLDMADAFRFNDDPAHARLYEDEAAAEAARIALREDAERRFAWSRIPVHAVGDEIPDQREGTGAAAYLFGAVGIFAGITMGIPAVCWVWAWLGGLL